MTETSPVARIAMVEKGTTTILGKMDSFPPGDAHTSSKTTTQSSTTNQTTPSVLQTWTSPTAMEAAAETRRKGTIHAQIKGGEGGRDACTHHESSEILSADGGARARMGNRRLATAVVFTRALFRGYTWSSWTGLACGGRVNNREV